MAHHHTHGCNSQERRKRKQGKPNFSCSPKQMEELFSYPEELGTTGVLCHGKPWEEVLRAPKLNHHDVTVGISMVSCGSYPIVSTQRSGSIRVHMCMPWANSYGQTAAKNCPSPPLFPPPPPLPSLCQLILLLWSARSGCLAQTSTWDDRSPLPGFLWD